MSLRTMATETFLFPAGAGVILKGAKHMNKQKSVPRRGGGDPCVIGKIRCLKCCSPQGRG